MTSARHAGPHVQGRDAEQHRYGARNVANAMPVQRAIRQRSRLRQDPDEVGQWLGNHFWRYAVGNFTAPAPAVQAIRCLEDAQRLFHPEPLPAWMVRQLADASLTGEPAVWWVEPASDALLALEQRLLEFLLSRTDTALEGKLMRVNCFQALARWEDEHRAFAAKLSAGWQEHRPEAVCTRWQGSTGRFVELLGSSPWLRHEMAYESQLMRHCLGQFADRKALCGGYGEHYASACEAGDMRLFSLRKDSALPHVTISVRRRADNLVDIEQIKGKQNRPPISRYQDDVRDFLNSLPTSMVTPQDAAHMGLLRMRDGWFKVADLTDREAQLQAVQMFPGMIRAMPDPDPLVQWVVAGIQPDLLSDMPVSGALRAALEGPQ